MSSARRIASSRANGKKSQGPVTPEGKTRSSANARRHCLSTTEPARLAESVCLTNESPAQYIQLHEALIAEHLPSTATELLLVEEMAVARWRVRRAWVMETALLDNQMDHMMDELDGDYETMDEATRMTLAFRELADRTPSLQVLQRYESRLSRQFERCLKRLAALRATRLPEPAVVSLPMEPNPGNGHSLDASECLKPPPPTEPQPASAPTKQRQSTVVPAERAPEVDGVCPRPRCDDSEPLPGPPPALPRTA